jgi:hypothetical protein
MLDSDLFGFFGFDRGGDVGEGALGRGAVLGYVSMYTKSSANRTIKDDPRL